jgi:hypothetical protein
MGRSRAGERDGDDGRAGERDGDDGLAGERDGDRERALGDPLPEDSRELERPAVRVRSARRRRRTRRAVAAVGLVLAVAAVGTAVALTRPAPDATGPSSVAALASPSPSPSPAALRIVADGPVEAKPGEVVVLSCRVDGEGRDRFSDGLTAGSSRLEAVFEIASADGRCVKRFRLSSRVRPGGPVHCRWRVDLEPGRYRYLLRLEHDGTPVAADVASAALVVTPPPGFPGHDAIGDAFAWADRRDGVVSVAVVDTNGRLHGLDAHRRYKGASLVKVMLLVAWLRAHPERPAPAMRDVLRRMITESDNLAADRVFADVGRRGFEQLAAKAGMKDFSSDAHWITAMVSAADQAAFFAELEKYVPPARRAFVRDLLHSITAGQRWGVPAAAEPAGWEIYFKAGWLDPHNELVVQAAWLERRGRRFALAVMTDENPDWTYGFGTLEGVTGILVGAERAP